MATQKLPNREDIEELATAALVAHIQAITAEAPATGLVEKYLAAVLAKAEERGVHVASGDYAKISDAIDDARVNMTVSFE